MFQLDVDESDSLRLQFATLDKGLSEQERPRSAIWFRGFTPAGWLHVATFRLIRRQKVLLDDDLARLYGALAGGLHEQVRRTASRFPADFMPRLGKEEALT